MFLLLCVVVVASSRSVNVRQRARASSDVTCSFPLGVYGEGATVPLLCMYYAIS